jgi:uncharacterized protein (TIGR00725 family)
MKKKTKYKIVVSGAADVAHCCPDIKELSKEIGREVVRQGCVLLTGATTGAPYFSAQGCKEEGGMSIGFSPANSEKEHLKVYHLPTDQFDLIVYTGFDYVGRNLILTKAADGVIIVCGRTGTLNEFTVAFESKMPIGVLKGSGGTADLIDEVLKRGYRPKKKIVSDTNPKKLVQKLISLIEKEKKSNKK